MRVEVGGQEYQVFFPRGKAVLTLGCNAHGQPTGNATSTEVDSVKCIIRPVPTAPEDQPAPITEAEALCSPSDCFDPAMGRKVALTRALRSSRFTREERREFWQWYRRTHRLPNRSVRSILKARIAQLEQQLAKLTGS